MLQHEQEKKAAVSSQNFALGPHPFSHSNPLIGKSATPPPFQLKASSQSDGFSKRRRVHAEGDEAKELLHYSLSPEESKYLKFNRKGFVKKGKLNRGKKRLEETSGNYDSLLGIVNNQEGENFDVKVADQFELLAEQGNPDSKIPVKMGPVSYESDAEARWDIDYRDRYEKEGKSYAGRR